MPPTSEGFALGTDLQAPVTKFAAALGTPDRLLKLAPKSAGNPGNAAALSPAIVLTTISAFEGFAEDFLATVLALQGNGLAQIAKEVGRWNNPTLREWVDIVAKLVSPAAQEKLETGPLKKISVYRVTASGNWSPSGKRWEEILEDSDAWMQVRHLLTHGLATGWRAERWPPPLRKDVPGAASVLRPKGSGKASLDRSGAKSCARIYTLGAKHAAEAVASNLGKSLDWADLPEFQ
jgi:hypothetical protein